MPERCANCERVIGKLETPHIYRNQIVCAECRHHLPDVKLTSEDESPSKPTKKRKVPPGLRVMFFVGLLLWVGPALLLVPMAEASSAEEIRHASENLQPLAWLGAILCIGSVVIWTIIKAAKWNE